MEENKKEKKSLDKKTIIEIVITIIMFKLFGILPGAIGIAATYALDKKLKVKYASEKWVFPACCVAGVMIALVLSVILAILFGIAL